MTRTNRIENTIRAEWYARAEFYVWRAKRTDCVPTGNDPLTGRPWSPWAFESMMARAMGRASYVAMARAAYANARRFSLPIPA